MARTDRLLAIVQTLRRRRYPVTAKALAGDLGVSERTLYRDIATLQASGAPIRGEAGVGYVLGQGYDLPPLMFSAEELEALMLGVRFVLRRGDPGLARAAEDAIAKIETVLPAQLRPVLADTALYAPWAAEWEDVLVDEAAIRRAIRSEHKLRLTYRDGAGSPTERLIWPVAMGYRDGFRMVAAWCELRGDFRHFRTDRMVTVEVTDRRFPERRAVLQARWKKTMAER